MQPDLPPDDLSDKNILKPGEIGAYLSASSFWIPDWIPEVTAWVEHAPFAFWLVENLRPARIVELGTHWAYSYLAFCQAVQQHQIPAVCHAIDTWKGDEQAGFYGENVYSTVAEYNQDKYNAFSSLIRSTFDEALPYFADGSIDLLHIDGFHTYEAVKNDFEKWRPKLSRRAVVLFHDINVHERNFGISRLWQELCRQFPHFSFYHGHGLGVLSVGKERSALLESFFQIPQESLQASNIRNTYARLGAGLGALKTSREMETRLAEHASEALHLNEENSHLRTCRDEFQRRLHEETSTRHTLADEATELRARVNALSEQTAHSQAHLASVAAEIRRLTSGNLALQGQKALLEEQLANAYADVTRFLSENAALKAQINQLRQQLALQSEQKIELDRLARAERTLWQELTDLQQKAALEAQEAMLEQEETARQFRIAQKKMEAGQQAAEWLAETNRQQKKIIKSAQEWQARSWFKRAFHRWRIPDEKARKIALLKKGKAAAKGPAALLDSIVEPAQALSLLEEIFAEKHYQQQLSTTTIGMPLLEHYRTEGWRNGLTPNPLFDTNWYLQHNPDVAEAQIEPLEHYLKYGWQEERDPHPFFSAGWYLKTYPDVRQAGMEPLHHYLQWGWKEGSRSPGPFGDGDWFVEFLKLGNCVEDYESRKTLHPMFEAQLKGLPGGKPNILVVTHDTSRTGAPTIALNLISELKATYNIITIALGSESLDAVFEAESAAFICAPTRSYPGVKKASTYVQFILERCKIEFAIVNSIESWKVLPALARNDIPTVHLIHEFAGYSRPTEKLRRAAFLSSATVFPAKVVYENAVSVCGELQHRAMRVLPQGFCEFPRCAKEAGETLREKTAIKNALRPEGWEDAVVILGIGTVQMRKGVDLFFLCAEDVIKNNPAKKVRFVWAGPGFDPEADIHFSVYLADQLRRMAAGEAACLMGEISQPQYAYELADILLLSSRMDPFPLVAQEAMRNALPVICFEKAAGTAELLLAHPETASCVVPYLDIEAAVTRIQHFIERPEALKKTGHFCRSLAEEAFDLKKYVRSVEQIAREQQTEKQQEIRDRAIIAKAGLLDFSYLISPSQPEIWSNPAWWYARAWASRVNLRKPRPGFHPGVYAEENGITHRDPSAHYIEAGQPAGLWKTPVIELTSAPPVAGSGGKVALHLHLFYPEMAGEIFERLKLNKSRFDLFITVPEPGFVESAEETFKQLRSGRLEIKVVPNRGRDIGAFLSGFGTGFFNAYDMVGHLHTKQSHWLRNPRFVKIWSDFLLENHLGGKHASMDAILAALHSDPALGLIYPDDPHVIPWGENLPHGQDLCRRLGLPAIERQQIDFPIGTFFWARTAAIRKLLDLPLDWLDYPPEPLPGDGTLLHAMERLLPLLAREAGFQIATTRVSGVTR